MENVKKHRDIKLVTKDKRRNQLASEPNYHTTKYFSENLIDTDSFAIYIKTEDFYKDIANDVEEWFDTSNYSKNDNIPLPIHKNKKKIGFSKMN